ncbi:MAG: hypothetical protein J6T52_12795 [Bacteroidaceae bacterium]|nr:hypothetical protein [Bacteroidaceae bacterium]
MSIINPEFDGQGLGGWKSNGFWTQTNSDFPKKSNYAYAERWISSTSRIPDSYLFQSLTSLQNGKYRLTAAAQNLKQNQSTTNQSGAYLVGNENTTPVYGANDYSVDFYVVDGTANIGFYTENSTANWIACDNFRLSRLDTGVTYEREGLNALITVANQLTSASMDATVKTTLNNAITNARKYTSNGISSQVKSAYTTLKSAMQDAKNSIFATKTASGTGTAPTVVTDPRYAVGNCIAFGRSTVSSSATILEQGFCYSSTNTEPTVADNRSSRYLDHAGNIYVMDDLIPATAYYIRAYAVTKNYKVGYGDVIRIYTLPKGVLNYTFNASGDAAIDARIKGSFEALKGYWQQCTSITGFTPSANYESGVQTADCSYGGWVRFGPNVSYQATGTAMHEVLHGIGVGTHTSWNSHMSAGSYGTWYGKRATQLVQFWDNSTTEYVTGGGSHLWATNGSTMISFTINGAYEDAHSDLQYYGSSLFSQALCEDGMVHAYAGFLPGYCFQHEDDTKYYIRNTHADYGLTTSAYLVASGTSLQWKNYDSHADAINDDKAAWYISFDPATQYYYFKNVGTGKYIYFTGNSFNASGSAKNSSTQIHLHLGYWDATVGEGSTAISNSSYYFMHPTSNATPPCMTATAGNALSTSAYSPAESNTAARWMILTSNEIELLQTAEMGEYERALTLCRSAKSQYERTVNGAASSALAQFTWTNVELATKTSAEVSAAVKVLNHGATIAAAQQVATSMIQNADFTQGYTGPADGHRVQIPTAWTFTYQFSGWNDTFVDANQKLFNAWAGSIAQADLSQTLSGLPNGLYRLTADVKTDINDGTSQLALFANPLEGYASRSPEVTGEKNEFSTYSLVFKLENNQVDLGVRSSFAYYQVKNFRLEFVTADLGEWGASMIQNDYYPLRTQKEVVLTDVRYDGAQGAVLYPLCTNQIIRINTEGAISQPTTNVVENGVCQSLVITDGESISIEGGDFEAVSASYERNTSYTFGMLLLPCEVRSDDHVQFYQQVGLDDGYMAFRAVDNVPANTPVLFKKRDAAASSVLISGSGAVVNTSTSQGQTLTAPLWITEGCYAASQFTDYEGIFYLSADKFWEATGTVSVPAYRAVYRTKDANIKIRGFKFIDDTDAISLLPFHQEEMERSAIYTLSGQQVGTFSSPRGGREGATSGIYLIQGKKWMVK